MQLRRFKPANLDQYTPGSSNGRIQRYERWNLGSNPKLGAKEEGLGSTPNEELIVANQFLLTAKHKQLC